MSKDKVTHVMCLVCGHIEKVEKALEYVNGNCSHCGIKFVEVYYRGVEVRSALRFDLIRGKPQPANFKSSARCRKIYLGVRQDLQAEGV
jgi:hypothetical protein